VSAIVKRSYTGLFVDEYQDCTVAQHNFINVLSEILPTRILGDPLQGIFGFGGEQLVDLDDDEQMVGFSSNKFLLTEPQRWMRGNNTLLGADLKRIRELLRTKQAVDLASFTNIESYAWPAIDFYNGSSAYARKIREFLLLDDVLFIHPASHSVQSRLKFAKMLGGRLNMLEAIDSKEFYQLAKIADRIDNEEPILLVRELSYMLFNKTALNEWFNESGLKRKNSEADKNAQLPVRECAVRLSIGCSFNSLAELLKLVSELPKVKKYRWDLFNSIYWAMKDADSSGISVRTAMENRRNNLRRVGRKVYGRCLGTTLLTKGLEFDNVVVLNAQELKCPKHIYVALTRASKRLAVISNSGTLKPE
jgi:DNA helicase-2/ATP-dependent DNA helicase PcrA